VFSTSFERLDHHLSDLEQRFKEKKYKGKVIIDLLLSNGNSNNRYVEINFNGLEFEIKQAKTIQPNSELERISITFYKKNPELLDNCTLNHAQQFLVKKGILKPK